MPHGIATSASTATARRQLAAAGLDSDFDGLVTRDFADTVQQARVSADTADTADNRTVGVG